MSKVITLEAARRCCESAGRATITRTLTNFAFLAEELKNELAGRTFEAGGAAQVAALIRYLPQILAKVTQAPRILPGGVEPPGLYGEEVLWEPTELEVNWHPANEAGGLSLEQSQELFRVAFQQAQAQAVKTRDRCLEASALSQKSKAVRVAKGGYTRRPGRFSWPLSKFLEAVKNWGKKV